MLSAICLFEHALYHISGNDQPLLICKFGVLGFIVVAFLAIFLITKKIWK